MQCHPILDKPSKSVHGIIKMGCNNCHVAVEGKNHPGEKNSMKLTQNVPELCYSCHDESSFKGKIMHTPVTKGMCLACHAPHSSNAPKLLLQEMPQLCFSCHDGKKFKGKDVHKPVDGGKCTGCHSAHSSGTAKLLLMKSPDLCYTCHDKTKFTKKNVHQAISAVGCDSCHSPHVSNFPRLLPNSIHEVCVTCHRPQAKGLHVISLPGKKSHPVSGVPEIPKVLMKKEDVEKLQNAPEPKNEKQLSCISCHDPHSSDYAKLFTAERICLKCHTRY